MQIIDGYCNEPNIFADDIGEYNTAIWGTRDCVLPAGERLGYELVSNNEIKIKDGVFSTQGRRGVIKKGTTDSCIIENGTQAENRNDLIVIEYAKDSSTLVESHTLKVIKGTPGEAATDPDVVTGDIQAGDVLHQMPLYRVKLEGLNVVAVERLFSVGNNAIGKEFDPDKDYEIGDLTLQYNKAWKFKVKHLAGAWDESQMEETDVLTELAAQNKNFGGISFGIDGDGNRGYYGADGSLVPFKSFDEVLHGYGYGVMQWGTKKYSESYNIPEGVKEVIVVVAAGYGNGAGNPGSQQKSSCNIVWTKQPISYKDIVNSNGKNTGTFYSYSTVIRKYKLDGTGTTVTISSNNSGSMLYGSGAVIYNQD